MEKKPARKGSKAAKAESSGDAVEKKRWKLKDGSLLVMQGETLEIFRSHLSPYLNLTYSNLSLSTNTFCAVLISVR